MAAVGLLYTLNFVKRSVGRRSRSTSRLVFCESVRPVEATAIGALFSSTLVKLVPRPRIWMLMPSPVTSRVISTPGMRLIDSAMFESGNLPMSSELIVSTKPVAWRLSFVDDWIDARRPVTITVSFDSGDAACCASACPTRPSSDKPSKTRRPCTAQRRESISRFFCIFYSSCRPDCFYW